MHCNNYLVIHIIWHCKTQSIQCLETNQVCLSETIHKWFGYTPLPDHLGDNEMDGARNLQTIDNNPRNFDDCSLFHKSLCSLQ